MATTTTTTDFRDKSLSEKFSARPEVLTIQPEEYWEWWNECTSIPRGWVVRRKLWNTRLPDLTSSKEFKWIYHGTTKDLAAQLSQIRFDLPYDGAPAQDFSHYQGFYFYTHKCDAIEMAKVSSAMSHHKDPGNEPVVISVKTLPLDQAVTFSLLDLRAGDGEWEEYVYRNRRETLGLEWMLDFTELHDYDFVGGPMCINGRSVVKEGARPIALPGSYQVCVKSDKMMELLRKRIHSVEEIYQSWI